MKKTVVLLAEGFEEVEALTVADVLRRAGLICDLCSMDKKTIKGAHEIQIKADKLFKDTNFNEYDAIVLPGGIPGATTLRDDKNVIEKVKEFNKAGKIVAAICAAPIVLAKAGIIEEKAITSYPGFKGELGNCDYHEDLVVQDGNIITSRGPATAMLFAIKLLQNLANREVAEHIRDGMLINLINK